MMNSVATWVLWCPPLLPTELLTAVLLSQGNGRLDTLQCLSASTQNISILCLLNKSWTLDRKASTSVCPVLPNNYIFPVSPPSSSIWHCTKCDLRFLNPTVLQLLTVCPWIQIPGLQCYQQSCWISCSLGENSDRLKSPRVLILLFLELELTKRGECCPLLAS